MFILELTSGVPCLNKKGIGIFEYDQAKALSKLGHRIAFVSVDLRSFRRKRKFGLKMFVNDDINIYNYSFPLGRVPNIILNSFAWFFFKKIIKKIIKKDGKPDIIHAHFGRFSGRIAQKAKKKYKIDYIVTEHDSTISENKINQKEIDTLKSIYNSAKKVVAVSDVFCKKIYNEYSQNVVYIPNIVDVDSFTLSRFIDVKNNFVSVGNLINGKGMDISILAFKKIITKGYEATLTIVGSGEKECNLKTLVNELDLQNQVLFTGQLPRQEIQKVFNRCFCFVLASRGETFGVVYIEAMCAGLPVIATKCGGPEGFITKDVGLIVSPNDVDQLATAMEYMINNKETYDNKAIREYALKNFAPDVVARQIAEVLCE